MSRSKELTKPTLPTLPGADATLEQLRTYNSAISALARQGNEEAVPQVRKWLEVEENADRLGGDLAYQVRWSLARKMAGDDLVFREAVLKKGEILRNELVGPNATPLERLLVDRVVVCWLYLYHLELSYSQGMDLTLALGVYRQKVLDRAHGRYLSTIKTLADVRRLALPALQLNIAKKQVNVAAGSTAVSEQANRFEGAPGTNP